MTPEQESQFDAVHDKVPKLNGMAAFLGIQPSEIVDFIKATIIKYKGDPANVSAHSFRLGTIMGYLYAQKEATGDKRTDA